MWLLVLAQGAKKVSMDYLLVERCSRDTYQVYVPNLSSSENDPSISYNWSIRPILVRFMLQNFKGNEMLRYMRLPSAHGGTPVRCQSSVVRAACGQIRDLCPVGFFQNRSIRRRLSRYKPPDPRSVMEKMNSLITLSYAGLRPSSGEVEWEVANEYSLRMSHKSAARVPFHLTRNKDRPLIRQRNDLHGVSCRMAST
jgi:hypothetical protein